MPAEVNFATAPSHAPPNAADCPPVTIVPGIVYPAVPVARNAIMMLPDGSIQIFDAQQGRLLTYVNNAAGVKTREDFVYDAQGKLTQFTITYSNTLPSGVKSITYDLTTGKSTEQYKRGVKSYSSTLVTAVDGKINLGADQGEIIRWKGTNASDQAVYALVALKSDMTAITVPSTPPNNP